MFAGVLPPLLRLQQLDCHDIEGIGPLFMRFCQQFQHQSEASQHLRGDQTLQQHQPSCRPLSGHSPTALPSDFHQEQHIPSSQDTQQRQSAAEAALHLPVSPFHAAPSAAVQTLALQPASGCGRSAQPPEGSIPNAASVIALAPASQADPNKEYHYPSESRAQVHRGPHLTGDQLLQLPEAEACAAVRDYLIAAAAKDCSLMLCMQRMTPAHPRTAHGKTPQDATPEDATQASLGVGGSTACREVAGRAVSGSAELLPMQGHQTAARHHADVATRRMGGERSALTDAAGPTDDDAAVCSMTAVSREPKETRTEGLPGPAESCSLIDLAAGNMKVKEIQAAADAVTGLNHPRPSSNARLPVGLQGWVDVLDGSRVGYALVIIDLDRKAASKIPKHQALDAEIMQHASERQHFH